MTMNKNKPIDLNNIKPEEQLKYEVAEELGLLPKVLETGWRSLSAKESGRIGGIITRKKKQMKQESMKQEESIEK